MNVEIRIFDVREKGKRKMVALYIHGDEKQSSSFTCPATPNALEVGQYEIETLVRP